MYTAASTDARDVLPSCTVHLPSLSVPCVGTWAGRLPRSFNTSSAFAVLRLHMLRALHSRRGQRMGAFTLAVSTRESDGAPSWGPR